MRSTVWDGDFPVTQPWGQVSPTYFHCGVDIGMPTGTVLRAARAGIVTHRGYGFLGITIDGGGQTDWYLHIDASWVNLGSHVVFNQNVGLSGAKQVPGGPPITGPHLHFEVQTGLLDHAITSLDPVPVLLLGEEDLKPDEHDHLVALSARSYWFFGGTDDLSGIKLSDGRPVTVTAIPGAITLPELLKAIQSQGTAGGLTQQELTDAVTAAFKTLTLKSV